MSKQKEKNKARENHRPPQTIPEKKQAIDAHREAEKDMEKDTDLTSKPRRGDGLDEGELARLEGED